VLEAVWKAAPPDERQLWRGLAQLAVGVTHSQRGNRKGAAALLQRGAANLLAHDGASYDIDIELLVAWARDAANAATTGNPLPPCPADWRSGRG
jgi:predicted metal-dependent hydrolase